MLCTLLLLAQRGFGSGRGSSHLDNAMEVIGGAIVVFVILYVLFPLIVMWQLAVVTGRLEKANRIATAQKEQLEGIANELRIAVDDAERRGRTNPPPSASPDLNEPSAT